MVDNAMFMTTDCFLDQLSHDQKQYWQVIKPVVSKLTMMSTGDDTIEEKPYSDESERSVITMIASQGRSVMWINLLNFIYQVTMPEAVRSALPPVS
ncbi:MAG: hypothetical protein U0401_10365 [Anaerolineae bacterium]